MTTVALDIFHPLTRQDMEPPGQAFQLLVEMGGGVFSQYYFTVSFSPIFNFWRVSILHITSRHASSCMLNGIREF